MSNYFDETLFTDARSLIIDIGESEIQKAYITVSNNADKYLLETLHNLTANKAMPCRPIEESLMPPPSNANSSDNDQNDSPVCNIININPKIPCIGINIYTLNMSNIQIQQIETFNQIIVMENDNFKDDSNPIESLTLDEYKQNVIYNIGKLTPFEMAIMIKYYAINNANIRITRLLYNAIRKYFIDKRSWFKRSDIGIVQNHYSELMIRNELVNAPNLDIYSEAISIN